MVCFLCKRKFFHLYPWNGDYLGFTFRNKIPSYTLIATTEDSPTEHIYNVCREVIKFIQILRTSYESKAGWIRPRKRILKLSISLLTSGGLEDAKLNCSGQNGLH